MGRGGRGPSPNDDRSRSMNPQDPVGQAAAANEAAQRGDDYDDWDDDDAPSGEAGEVIVVETEEDYSHWGVYRDEPRRSEAWRDFNPLEDGYDWKKFKAKSKPKPSDVG